MWRIPQWFPDLSPSVESKLKAFHGELLKFNLKLNLISRTTERDADEVHFADSIYGARLVLAHCNSKTIMDIGAGNGLPGLVFATLSPDRVFNLVESDGRKAEFLKHIVHLIGLANVQVSSVRFENLKGTGTETAVSRGFASISKTLLACNRIFSVGGQFYHFKGSNWATEIAEVPPQLISVWTPVLIGEYSLPVSQARRAIVFTKKIA